MQNGMNDKMVFIALLPLSVVVGLLHVYIMIHIGLFALIFLAMMVYVDERIISARSQNPASLLTVEYYNKINKCWIAAMKQYLTQKDA